jgi:hypothetical protein
MLKTQTLNTIDHGLHLTLLPSRSQPYRPLHQPHQRMIYTRSDAHHLPSWLMVLLEKRYLDSEIRLAKQEEGQVWQRDPVSRKCGPAPWKGLVVPRLGGAGTLVPRRGDISSRSDAEGALHWLGPDEEVRREGEGGYLYGRRYEV